MKTAREKLPLLVNGTLSGEERETLLAEINQDKTLQDEMAFLTNLRAGLRNQPEEVPGDLILARVKKGIREEQRKPQSQWWRTGAVAACALLALQSAFMFNTLQEQQAIDGTNIQLLSGADTVANLQVVFSANTTVAQIQQVLADIDAEVVSGPSALGVFGLHLSGSIATQQAVTMLDAMNFVEEVVELEATAD